MTAWLIVILGLLVLWLVVSPRTAQTARGARKTIVERVPFLPKTDAAQRQQIRMILIRSAKARGAALGAESQDSLKEFIAWLDRLSDKELGAFVESMDAAMRTMNLNVVWLLQGRARGEMAQSLRLSMLLYALAVWLAQDVAPLARLEAYLANPNARRHQEFARQVFARLVETQSESVSPDMILAPEKKRRKYVFETIDRAARENQDHLIAIVQSVMDTAKVKKPRSAFDQMLFEPAETKSLPPGAAEVSV